jgi:trk system potassium uptake protein TrkA
MAKLQEIAIVGLDAFGFAVATELFRLGHPVLAIDRDPSKIHSIQGQVTHAIEADVSQIEIFKELGLKDVDAVLVSLGSNFQTSLLTTFALKELGVKNLLVKAEGAKRRKILKLAGADMVIQPENDIALQTATFMHYSRVIDYMELDRETDVVALQPPKTWINRTVHEINCHGHYQVHILAILNRQVNGEWQSAGQKDTVVTANSVLLVMGHRDDLAVIQKVR